MMNDGHNWCRVLFRAYGTVEDDTSQDEISSLPVVGLKKKCRQRSKDEGAETGTADGNARCQGTSFFKIIADRYNSRQVNEAETDTAQDTVSDHHHGD